MEGLPQETVLDIAELPEVTEPGEQITQIGEFESTTPLAVYC